MSFVARSPALADAIDVLRSDFLCLGAPQRYAAVVDSLLNDDRYMVCADFASFRQAMRDAACLYASPPDWVRKVVFNIAGASNFSSDATIAAYARDIWGLSAVMVDTDAASPAR